MCLVLAMAPELDSEGFLKDLNLWNPDVAVFLAEVEGIALTPEHWEIIQLVRNYYGTYRLFPPLRVLVTQVKNQFGPAKGSSIHIMGLFTGKPVRVIARIAGLPKPPNCD